MANLTANDVRIFVPAKDFSVSKDFYQALGWKMLLDGDDVAMMELANCRFLLQNYYHKDWAGNFMLTVIVEDAQAWHDFVVSVFEKKKYPGVWVKPPAMQPWGALTTYVADPSGVLLHFAQFDKD
jgi:catechol 2,3-dioxygenase-like lactoylglutathione lyase family enzyme